ncbi:glycosyltransferase family 4 protein [Arthrobacter sp. BB-1]|nr:glycosyltransferase family 4 protein [Arthrobacter sp. BB-1]
MAIDRIPLKVLLYADFRSPHAHGWATGLERAGIEVIKVSSEFGGNDPTIVEPTDALAKWRQQIAERRRVIVPRREESKKLDPGKDPAEWIHTVLAIVRFPQRVIALRKLCRQHRPDLVHALRLPYEGVTALSSGLGVPVILSTWGQDFVPQVESSPLLRWWASRAIRRAAGLQFDSSADFDRAVKAGFDANRPSLFAAGNFGVDGALFYTSEETVPNHIVFPRGRSEMSNGRAFIEIATKLACYPDLTFTAIGLEGIDYAEQAKADPLLGDRLCLTPALSLPEFASVIRSAAVVVSPALTDGTPISLLSALAAGAPVVAGRIPALDQLANTVDNVYLADANSTEDFSEVILQVLKSESSKVLLPEEFLLESNKVRVREFYLNVLRSTT